MILTVFDGNAEFERSLIHQRTSTGRAAAKKRGVRFGRPPSSRLSRLCSGIAVDEGTSVRDAAALLKRHPAKLYRALQTENRTAEFIRGGKAGPA